jgi:imidazoleglycerol phosphate dehydratase HisB
MGKFERITKETDISVEVDFNSTEFEINTPIPFFSHMLETFAKHSNIGIKLIAKGDIEVDEHHTVEDTAIALGNAFRDALSDKKGIERFGHAIVPMDESVAICGVDISGRGVFRFEGEIEGEVKGLKAENFLHFLETFSRESGINIYLSISGKNMHHMFEAGFKALAVSIRNAIKIAGEETRSTKGVLD